MKKEIKGGRLRPSLSGKTLALVFEKSSMRTRVSFEVAMLQLGGHSIYLSRGDIDLGKREPVKDGARVLSRYVDGIAARVFAHATVEELAAHSTVPVINALSDKAHPCQALGDIMTVEEKFSSLEGVKLAYIGDANNVARSLAVICAKLGIHYAIACPRPYQFDAEFQRRVRELAVASKATLEITDSPGEAAAGADVLYTDTWVSMGQEAELERRLHDFQGYTIDAGKLQRASKRAIVMHCMPAYRGKEITDEVIEGPQSVVFDQAENRMHAQRALLHLLLGGGSPQGQ
jgi:ornithine carbamoyltransferase